MPALVCLQKGNFKDISFRSIMQESHSLQQEQRSLRKLSSSVPGGVAGAEGTEGKQPHGPCVMTSMEKRGQTAAAFLIRAWFSC